MLSITSFLIFLMQGFFEFEKRTPRPQEAFSSLSEMALLVK